MYIKANTHLCSLSLIIFLNTSLAMKRDTENLSLEKKKLEQQFLDAATHDNKKQILELIRAGVNINTRDESGATALANAAAGGALEVIQILLSQPTIEVVTYDKSAFSPLMRAAEFFYTHPKLGYPLVEFLLYHRPHEGLQEKVEHGRTLKKNYLTLLPADINAYIGTYGTVYSISTDNAEQDMKKLKEFYNRHWINKDSSAIIQEILTRRAYPNTSPYKTTEKESGCSIQ